MSLCHLSIMQRFFGATRNDANAPLKSSLRNLVAEMVSKKSVVSPQKFKKRCGFLHSEYSGTGQQDAHEFCMFLLNQIIDEEESMAVQNNGYERASFRNMFEGLMSISIVCNACFSESGSYQTFISMCLPVASVGSSAIELSRCLDEAFQPVALFNRSCPVCKGNSAEYRTSITLPPPVLILHLLRFSNSSKKIETRIKFPLSLELSPWMSAESETDCIYELRAVINHFVISTDEGHYTSYCKDPVSKEWFCYDDKWVDLMSEQSVQTKSAYMLFYEQRENAAVEQPIHPQPMEHLCEDKNKAKETAEKQSAQQQQLNPPSNIFNMDDIREARRDKALLILDKELPELVVRLRALHRRSKEAADKRGCFSGDQLQESTDGGAPYTGAKKQSLPNKLASLVQSAYDLLEEHVDLMKEGNEKKFEKKKKSNGKRWEKLMKQTKELAETHLKIRHSDQPDEEYVLRKELDDARMILGHPVFASLQPEGEEEDSADSSEPLVDTAELIGLVTGEMRQIIECCVNLKHWIMLYTPPLNIITEYECVVWNRITTLIDKFVCVCEDSLKSEEEFMLKRMEFQDQATENPLSLDRVRALDAFESTKGVEWRRHINRLALQCVEVMDFIVKHREILEECKSRLRNSNTSTAK